MIGKTILHYRILEQIGQGGMGVVYKAEDTKLDRFVALKFLPHHLSQSEEQKQRFIQEAKAASALDHPNICTIYEIDETEDGQMFIAMANYEGKSLLDMIHTPLSPPSRGELKGGVSEGKPLPLDKAIDYAIQISHGLAKAHSKEIIHRDIKPANLLVTEEDVVKIVDFGLAKLAGRTMLTKEATILGTASYMSPEQTQGTAVDHRTDIWALGVVLYEMLTGRKPFEGDYEQAVMYSIMNEDPDPIPVLRENVPSQLISIVEKTLQKNPRDRFQTTKDMLDELKTLGKSVSSIPEKEAIHSVAVLPFANMSNDKEQEYFCDGMAEDIINDLAHLEGLQVVARTSSFAFKAKNLDIREIGMKLGANSIVEGSVRKAGNRLRITALLINVADGYHLWSERYDRELEDVFAIQDEIAKNIVRALEIKLSKREKHVFEKVKTKDVQAYDFYIRGRAYYHQGDRDKTHLAILMFKKAIQKDKNYALAYAGLADGHSHLYMYYDKRDENLEHALSASRKAFELDPDLPEVHASLALALAQNKQYKEAEKEFETAIQLDPKFFEAYYEYARTCRAQGKHEQAVKLFEKASRIRPEDYEAALFLVSAYNDLDLESEMKKANLRALDVVRKHLELNPDDARAFYLGAGTLAKAGEPEEALQWVEKAVSINPRETAVLYNATCIYSLLGKFEQALDYFESAIEAGFASKEWIESDSDLDAIRGYPRFQKALKKLN